MSDLSPQSDPLAGASREDMLTALFADLVVRQTNMALMFLGQAPLPQTGERTVDLSAAQMFIDQLEALEVKTRGNLSKGEDQLVKQSLANLRMLFVQVSERPPETGAKPPASPAEPAASTVSSPAPTPAAAVPAPASGEESKVKYSKKY